MVKSGGASTLMCVLGYVGRSKIIINLCPKRRRQVRSTTLRNEFVAQIGSLSRIWFTSSILHHNFCSGVKSETI